MPRTLTRFIAASGVTNLADGVATVAWAWLASLLTRDALLIAMVPVALRLPWFLCAIPAGVMTDRVDRRQLILAMDLLRAAAFAIAAGAVLVALPLAAAPAQGVSAPGLFTILLLAAALVGVAEVFRDNAAQTLLPTLVPHAQLERANGRLWSVELTGNALLGPVIGAFLIGVWLPLPFVLNALAYLLAIGLMVGLPGTFRVRQAQAADWRREVREAFAFLASAPLLRTLALLTGLWNLLAQVALIALVLHVQENLGLGAQGYGLVLAAGAVGGILGGLFGEYIVRVLGPGPSAQWMLAASAPAFLGFALAPTAIGLALVLLVFEFAGMVWNTVSVSYRQRTIPNQLLGRVNSLYRLLAWGMMPLGLVLSGLIVRAAEAYVPRGTALLLPFVAASLGALVLVVWAWGALARGLRSSV